MKIFYVVLLLVCTIEAVSQEDIFSLVRLGDVNKISSLLNSEADLINRPNEAGFSILILAAYRGHDEIVDFLLIKDANVNYKSEMGTALTAAVFRGNFDLSTKLLNREANPDIADLKGVTPLMYAAQFKNKDIIKLLLQFNADRSLKDISGKTAFEYAINSKDEEVINLLK